MNTIRENLSTNLTTTNKRQATCSCCGNAYPSGTMHGYKATNRSDDKFQYICDWCITNDRYHSERSRDALVVGKVENGVICGIECEMSEMNDFARNWYYSKNWKATDDSSLDGDSTCEMVSNPNKGFKAFTKQLPIIEKLLENGDIEINESCGTHFHVSYNNMMTESGQNVMSILRRNRRNIFGGMYKLMLENPQKTEEFFGRNFTKYAKKEQKEDIEDALAKYGVNSYQYRDAQYTDKNSKYRWINFNASNNIEFRINKFVNAKQYHKLCMFEIEITKYIVQNIDNPKVKYEKMSKVLANKLEKAWA